MCKYWPFLLFCLVLVFGCGKDASPGEHADQLQAPDLFQEGEHIHDVGAFIAGTPISFSFQVRNTNPETARLDKDADIELNCGCSSIVPSTRIIMSGETAFVVVKMSTVGMRGKVSHGGKIVWTTDSGERKTTSFSVSGEAIAPIRAEPELLEFEPREITTGVVKEIVFTGNIPLDWSRPGVSSSNKKLKILKVVPESDRVRCQVQWVGVEVVEEREERIVLCTHSNSASHTYAADAVFCTVPVRVRKWLGLSVLPKVVEAKFTEGNDRITTKLVVRGERLNAAWIEAVTCEGYGLEWKLGSAEATTNENKVGALVLEVTLIRVNSLRPAKQPALLIKVKEVGIVRVPIVAAPLAKQP